jgi:hypothetical protein
MAEWQHSTFDKETSCRTVVTLAASVLGVEIPHLLHVSSLIADVKCGGRANRPVLSKKSLSHRQSSAPVSQGVVHLLAAYEPT